MKWLLYGWGGPVLFLGLWYGLSYHDMSFGFFMLTRETHDLVFQIYGSALGLPPESVPPLVLRAIIVDTFLVFGIFALRRRKKIMAWWRARQEAKSSPLAARDSADRRPRAP